MIGFVQKFVEPKNNRNCIIQATWSYQFCLLERRTNTSKITNSHVEFYDRLVTYEGAEHLSISDSITSPTLASDIHRTCLDIATHIKDINNGAIKVREMILHFKMDPMERLWLLYCTNLKVTSVDGKPHMLDYLHQPTISIPKRAKMFNIPGAGSNNQEIIANANGILYI